MPSTSAAIRSRAASRADSSRKGMTNNPAARTTLGCLLTRGGMHAHADALALKKLTGVDMKKLLPIPSIEGVEIPGSGPFMAEGMHRPLYRFSTGDYKEMGAIWQGESLGGSGPLEVIDGLPTSGPKYQAKGVAEAFIPNHYPEKSIEIVRKLYATI